MSCRCGVHGFQSSVWVSLPAPALPCPQPRWPSGKGARLESGRPGFDLAFAVDLLSDRVIPVT